MAIIFEKKKVLPDFFRCFFLKLYSNSSQIFFFLKNVAIKIGTQNSILFF